MFRPLAALLLMPASFASAADPAAGRYQIVTVTGGFVRLDTQTGAMTYCLDGATEPRCAALEAAEIAPSAPAKQQSMAPDAKDQQDFNQAMSMAEQAMRRFMALTREHKPDCSL